MRAYGSACFARISAGAVRINAGAARISAGAARINAGAAARISARAARINAGIPSGPEVEVMQTSSDLGSSGSRELFPPDLSMYNSELTLDPEINTENPSLTSDFK